MDPHPVEFRPLENAADFLLSAADHLVGQPDARDLKYATLNVVAAVEIMLKERLAREHYSLVFARLGSTKGRSEAQQWEEGDFVSVSAVEALRRLRDVCSIEVVDEIPGFERLRELRNQFTHHGVRVAPQLIQTNAAQVLNFALSFIHQHLRQDDESLPEAVTDTLEAIRPRLAEIRGLVGKRWLSIQPAVDAEPFAIECPDCGEEALVPSEATRCLFCLAEYAAEDGASHWIDRVLGVSAYRAMKDGEDYPLHYCPSCGRETLVNLRLRESGSGLGPEIEWVCFAEGEAFSASRLGRCARCYEPAMARGREVVFCDECSESFRAD